MSSRAVMLFRLTAFTATLALAACSQGSVANDSLAANDADPALTSARKLIVIGQLTMAEDLLQFFHQSLKITSQVNLRLIK